MPYEIETKDGIVIRGIPDNIKPDDPSIKAKVTNARQAAGRPMVSAEDRAMADPTASSSFAQNAIEGAGKAFSDAGRGVAQIFGAKNQAAIDDSKKLDAPLMDTGGGLTGNIGANIAMTALPGAAATTIPRAAAMGGLLGGIQPVASDESRLQNIGVGAAGGGVGQAAANTVGRLIKPVQSKLNEPLTDLAKKAEDLGINLTSAQKTGSKPLKILDAVFENMPFTADTQAVIKETQRKAFTKAALNSVGENAELATPDVMRAARERIGGEFNRLTEGNKIKLGDAFLDAVGTVESKITPFSKGVRSAVDDAIELAAKGDLSGREYQTVRTSLGNAAKSAWATNSELGQALKTFKGALDEAASQSIPQADKAAWNTARAQWSNLKVLEKAAAPTSADAVAGNVSAAKLAHALKSADPKGFVYGSRSGDLGDLSRIGQAFIKDQIPDSGTAQRALYQKMLTSPLEALGAAIGGAGFPVQKLLNSEAGKKYLTQGLLPNSGNKSKLLAEALRRSAVAGGSALSLANAQ